MFFILHESSVKVYASAFAGRMYLVGYELDYYEVFEKIIFLC